MDPLTPFHFQLLSSIIRTGSKKIKIKNLFFSFGERKDNYFRCGRLQKTLSKRAPGRGKRRSPYANDNHVEGATAATARRWGGSRTALNHSGKAGARLVLRPLHCLQLLPDLAAGKPPASLAEVRDRFGSGKPRASRGRRFCPGLSGSREPPFDRLPKDPGRARARERENEQLPFAGSGARAPSQCSSRPRPPPSAPGKVRATTPPAWLCKCPG